MEASCSDVEDTVWLNAVRITLKLSIRQPEGISEAAELPLILLGHGQTAHRCSILMRMRFFAFSARSSSGAPGALGSTRRLSGRIARETPLLDLPFQLSLQRPDHRRRCSQSPNFH